MGCYTVAFASKKDMRKNKQIQFASDFYLFRVFDYQKDKLKSYKQAKKFVIDTYLKSSNSKPPLKSNWITIEDGEEVLNSMSFSGKMTGKIQFAHKHSELNLTDYRLTLKRLKVFYKEYPKGIIVFR